MAGTGASLDGPRSPNVVECFPDAVVQVLDKRTKTIVSTSLDALHRDRGRDYIPQQALLEQNPAFRAHFDVERSGEYFRVMNRPSKPVVSFLIIGLGKGLNANYHCEESPNWYLAVSGSKRWTLIEAEYSWLLYPSARGTGMRRFSEFLADEQGEPRDRQAYPLVSYAPRYEFELHPGDVVSFPAWMWHKTIPGRRGPRRHLPLHRPHPHVQPLLPLPRPALPFLLEELRPDDQRPDPRRLHRHRRIRRVQRAGGGALLEALRRERGSVALAAIVVGWSIRRQGAADEAGGSYPPRTRRRVASSGARRATT